MSKRNHSSKLLPWRFRTSARVIGTAMRRSGREFRIEVQQAAPVRTRISLSKAEEFARQGAVPGPQHTLRKERLRELLKIDAH